MESDWTPGNISQQHLGDGDTVLFPQPSADPNDPLRWSKWRKHAVFLSICLFACLNNLNGTVLTDSFLTISEQLDVSVTEASGLLSWVVLIQGLAVSLAPEFLVCVYTDLVFD